MSNLKQLREAIVKVVPGIMELEFGCEVFFIERKWLFAGFGKEKGTTMMLTDGKFPSTAYTTARFDKESTYEILGRPIRLSDVLVAIQKSSYCDGYAEYEAVSELCWGGNQYLIRKWNLLQDDLNLQDEPTIHFLHSILYK